ncbi:MAG TPA: MBL fold metallo-hydrolase [Burkholderiales bacterium]|nr:MBL fold metallo-hydrolase [Burkholderiales bacterium]
MKERFTRRQFIVRAGVAVAAVQIFQDLDPCCVLAADAPTAHEELFELKPVADGVYAAIAAPRYKVNSNAAVILTNDGVVVVDSHSKPSAALALYRQIQAITRQPIRAIVNTHFHWDHWQGNHAYVERFPDIEIIASRRTLENLTRPDAGAGGIPYVEKQLTTVAKEIEQLRKEASRTTDATKKARLQSNLLQAQDYLEELRQFKPALPTRTVADTLSLNAGGREIELMVLGRAHTDGDLFIYLPKEKVVATGDALIDWMPYLNDGYPQDWVRTLDALEAFDFARIIPGHGDVAPREHLAFFRGYLSDLGAAVKQAAAEGAALEEMKHVLADRLAPKYEQAMSKYPMGQYRERIGLNIEMMYRKLVGGG